MKTICLLVIFVLLNACHSGPSNSAPLGPTAIDELCNAAIPTTCRVSLESHGAQADSISTQPAMSADGRFVAFTSLATNLVENDTNSKFDIFVKDLKSGVTQRISVSTEGTEANGNSYNPSISDDGRFVVFESEADNLVANDTNGVSDIFLRDLNTETTSRISVDVSGLQSTDGASQHAKISGNGKFIVFESIATNLVEGDTNEASDVFLRDLEAATTEIVSLNSSGVEGNGDSQQANFNKDASLIVFSSSATNLVADDTNGFTDIFLRDLQLGTTIRINLSSSHIQSNGDSRSAQIEANGNFIVFSSEASNLVANDNNGVQDIFLRNLETETTQRISVSINDQDANDFSAGASLSANGRFIVFTSAATNLVNNDTNGFMDVFVRDLQNSTLNRVSLTQNGLESNGDSFLPVISHDGLYIAFVSDSTNFLLQHADSNQSSDIFLRALGTTH